MIVWTCVLPKRSCPLYCQQSNSIYWFQGKSSNKAIHGKYLCRSRSLFHDPFSWEKHQSLTVDQGEAVFNSITPEGSSCLTRTSLVTWTRHRSGHASCDLSKAEGSKFIAQRVGWFVLPRLPARPLIDLFPDHSIAKSIGTVSNRPCWAQLALFPILKSLRFEMQLVNRWMR